MSNYIGNQPSAGEFKKLDSIAPSFNGSLTQFDLDYNTVNQSVGDATQLIVSLNGIIQEPGTAYTLGIGGGSIVFASAPASTDTCHIVLLGGVGGTTTPTDGSVTASKLDSNLKDYLEETFTANGSQTDFTLTRAVVGANTLLVTIDGIVQPSSAFTASGTTLTISEVLAANTNVRVVHMGVKAGIYVPANDSVTTDMLANSINTDIAAGVAALPKAGGTMTGNITFGDNNQSIYGTGADLRVFHSGVHSFVQNTTGNMYLQDDNYVEIGSSSGEVYIGAIKDGAVNLRYDNVKKIETTSTGIDVTGTVNAVQLDITAGTDAKIYTSNSIGEVGAGNFAIQSVNSAGSALKPLGFRAEDIRFATGPEERMRIDNSGNVLVGKTTAGYNVDGFEAHQNGETYVSRSGTPMAINRNSSDGTLLNLYKDGAGVGSIGNSGGSMYISAALTGGLKYTYLNGTNAVTQPCNTTGTTTNGTHDLGTSGAKFRDLYLSGGIQFDSRSNKLDDYEEGTWTPLFGDNSTTASNGGQFSATYVKIGKLVTVSVDITTLTYSGANLNYMYGLPFAGGVSGVGNGGGGVGYTTTTNIVPGLHVTSNTSAIYFINLGTNVGGEILSISGKRFIFSLTYETS